MSHQSKNLPPAASTVQSLLRNNVCNIPTSYRLLPQRRSPMSQQHRLHQPLPLMQHDRILTRRKDRLVAPLDHFGFIRCQNVREGFAILAVFVESAAEVGGVVDGVVETLAAICWGRVSVLI